MIVLAALLAFAAVVVGGGAASTWLAAAERRRTALGRRLAAIAGPALAAEGPLLKEDRLAGMAFLGGRLGRLPLLGRLARMVRQAGLWGGAGRALLALPLLGVGGAFVLVATGRPGLGALAAGVVGVALPAGVVHRRRAWRARRFAEQLPDALDLVRAALQAGHGFLSACALVGEEFPEPIAREFRELTHEIRHGLPLREALLNLCERVDNPELPLLATGILIAQDTGGNLAEVLDNIAHTIRERFKLVRDVQVMTAQGRLSGLVLTVLPVGVGLLLAVTSPTYFLPMLGDPVGREALVYAALSLVCGHLVIRRLTRLEV
jgi:tight adherence protein B